MSETVNPPLEFLDHPTRSLFKSVAKKVAVASVAAVALVAIYSKVMEAKSEETNVTDITA